MTNGKEDIKTGRIDYGEGFYYIGEIREGKANGEGADYNPDGTISREGTFKDDELNGYGRSYVDGQIIYEGNFVNGEREGEGTMYALGIKMYEGDFHKGNRHGKGTQWWPRDNSMYEGDYVDDKRTGKGILYIDGIKRYEGDFVDGEFHGNGTFYDENGNILRSGTFAHNGLPYETCPMKGNKWVSITSGDGIKVAESYKLLFNLSPHIKDIKDTLELYVRYTDKKSEKVSSLAIFARFVSKGSALVLGGGPVFLDEGKMTIRINANKELTFKPTKIAMNVGTGAEEIVAYPLDKDEFKEICDADSVEIELTAGSVYKDWKQQLTGENILFLVRASWNGIFNENDYLTELQHSPAAANNKIVLLNAAVEAIFGIVCFVAWNSVFLLILFVGLGIYDYMKKNTGIFKYFIK